MAALPVSPNARSAQQFLNHEMAMIYGDAGGDLLKGENYFAEFWTSQQLTKTLESILQDRNWLESIADASYVHGNGFDKIVLVSSTTPAFKVRFHIWWPELTSEENIHDHRWDFCSVVMSGSLRMEHYEVANDGLKIAEYKYIDKGSSYQIEPVGQSHLKSVFTSILAAKSHYFLSYEVPHRIFPVAGTLTSTVIMQAPAVRQWTRLFTDRLDVNSEDVETPVFTAMDLEERIHRYLDETNKV